MKFSSILIVAILAAALLLLPACAQIEIQTIPPTATSLGQANATATPTALPTETPTPAATETPTPPPTNTPTPLPTATPTAVSTNTPTPTPEPAAAAEPLPFSGVFEGVVVGDRDSSAQLTLDITQEGNTVSGVAAISEGLQVALTGLFCPAGVQPVPASSIEVSGTVSPDRPRHLEAVDTVEVSGFQLEVQVVADVSPDYDTIDASIALFTPAVCSDPYFEFTLQRVE